MKSIWEEIPKPIFALAPMDDVTDTVFRQIIVETAKPDIFYSEFVSVDGLMSTGKQALQRKLQFTEVEQPLIAQLWGLQPKNYQAVSKKLAKQGYSGIDINMGCPVPVVIKKGACSALINNRDLASEIIKATQAGAAGRVPVSVKCRIGFNDIDLSWIEFLLSHKLDALAIHGRTTKELSKVPVHWDAIEQARKLRDKIAPQTKIIGNGDIISRAQGVDLAKKYQLDGVMLGRAIFHDPYVFAENSPWNSMSREEKLALYAKQIRLFTETWGKSKNPATLKKFAKVYVNGFPGASRFRQLLMEQNTADELLKQIESIAKT